MCDSDDLTHSDVYRMRATAGVSGMNARRPGSYNQEAYDVVFLSLVIHASILQSHQSRVRVC